MTKTVEERYQDAKAHYAEMSLMVWIGMKKSRIMKKMS